MEQQRSLEPVEPYLVIAGSLGRGGEAVGIHPWTFREVLSLGSGSGGRGVLLENLKRYLITFMFKSKHCFPPLSSRKFAYARKMFQQSRPGVEWLCDPTLGGSPVWWGGSPLLGFLGATMCPHPLLPPSLLKGILPFPSSGRKQTRPHKDVKVN